MSIRVGTQLPFAVSAMPLLAQPTSPVQAPTPGQATIPLKARPIHRPPALR